MKIPARPTARFVLDIGGETINIAGRIDRIDVGRVGDQTVFNVIDYKSGRRPTLTTDKIESGERLQPALYVMAAEALDLRRRQRHAALGRLLVDARRRERPTNASRCTARSKDGTANDTWEELKVKVVARIGRSCGLPATATSPVASRDPHCTSFCDFRTVCRIAQVRSVGKVWIEESES